MGHIYQNIRGGVLTGLGPFGGGGGGVGGEDLGKIKFFSSFFLLLTYPTMYLFSP